MPMRVQLTDEVETIIREKVESGLYPSADEVVQEALRLLDESGSAALAAPGPGRGR
jgi:antitoxin ParD1/3/4